jgi:hypothetical protein
VRLDDLARRSAEQARAAADTASAPDAADYRATKRRRAVLGASGVMALLAVVVVVGSLVFAGDDEHTVAVTTTVVQPTTTTIPVAEPSVPIAEPDGPGFAAAILGAGWEELDPGPVAGRHRVATAWTGSELFVWGGHGEYGFDGEPTDYDLYFQDGFLYDPVGGAWRPVAPLPAAVCRPIGRPSAIAAGEAIVLKGAAIIVDGCASTAAYYPRTDTWEPLRGEFFSRLGSMVSVAWTGDLLVAPRQQMAYRWSSGETIDLPAFPSGLDDGVHSPQRAHWTGDRVLAIGSGGVREWVPGADQWLLLDGPPVPDRARDSVWTDQGLLVVNYQMAAAFYRDGAWSRPGDLPLRFYECLAEAISVGGTPVVRMCSGLAIWEEVLGAWIPVALSDPAGYSGGRLLASEDTIYEIGPHFRRFQIRRHEDGSIVVPPTIPIGVMQLDIPAGFELVSSYAPAQDSAGFIPDDETIGVVFESPPGTRCTVTSTYGPGEDWPSGFTEGRDGVQVRGRPVTEYVDADGTVGMALHGSNGSDVAFAWCVGPSVADYRPAVDFIAGLWSPWDRSRGTATHHERAGLRFQIPLQWILAGTSLTPGVPGFERFSAATYQAQAGGERGEECMHVPQFALDVLGPEDAFVSVHVTAGPGPARTRPNRFTFTWLDDISHDADMPDKAGELLARACLRRPDRESMYLRWATFSDAGRGFLVIVAIGDDASDETRARVLAILDSMEWVGE